MTHFGALQLYAILRHSYRKYIEIEFLKFSTYGNFGHLMQSYKHVNIHYSITCKQVTQSEPLKDYFKVKVQYLFFIMIILI